MDVVGEEKGVVKRRRDGREEWDMEREREERKGREGKHEGRHGNVL